MVFTQSGLIFIFEMCLCVLSMSFRGTIDSFSSLLTRIGTLSVRYACMLRQVYCSYSVCKTFKTIKYLLRCQPQSPYEQKTIAHKSHRKSGRREEDLKNIFQKQNLPEMNSNIL